MRFSLYISPSAFRKLEWYKLSLIPVREEEKEVDIAVVDNMNRRPESRFTILVTEADNPAMIQEGVRNRIDDILFTPLSPRSLEESLERAVGILTERRRKEDGFSGYLPLTATCEQPDVDRALSYITAGCAQPLTLRGCARALNLSEGHLSRIFKEYTGLTFTGYLNRMRVNKSIELLTRTELAVKEIAEAVGIQPAYFSALFKNHTGITPNRFRKALSSAQ